MLETKLPPEEEFLTKIKQATGLEIGTDYGFIAGPGEGWFVVWKKNVDESYSEISIKCSENQFQNIIDFLNG